jgi:UDP-glucose 4-epimerase
MKILITGGNGNIAKIIMNNISYDYKITALGKDTLNLLNQEEVEKYLENNTFDILIHTAIIIAKNSKDDNPDIVCKNIRMFENIIRFSNKFKMIINLDSSAIYDRKTDIFNRKESELLTVPFDSYGFSKYLIYNRSIQYNNIFNLRLCNIFNINESTDKFIKSCVLAKKNSTEVIIFEDKYFDLLYEDDFITILRYYIDNINNQQHLIKTINVCYDIKYKLSDVAMLILDINQIKILNTSSNNNYSADATLLGSLNIKLVGLENSIKKYQELFMTKYS